MGQPDSLLDIDWWWSQIRRIPIEYSPSVGGGQPDSLLDINWWWSRIRRIPTEYSTSVCMGQPNSRWDIDWSYPIFIRGSVGSGGPVMVWLVPAD